MANYLSVSSNDTLTHKALPGAPETLCGKAVADEIQPRDDSVEQKAHPNTNWLVQPLECDICGSLSNQDSFLNVSHKVVTGSECPHCEDGFDASGNLCWNCGGSGWLDHGDEYNPTNGLDDLDLNHLRGEKVGKVPEDEEEEDDTGNKQKPGGWSNAPMALNADANPATPPANNRHFATNWTRDGVPIEEGFNVVISTDEAARIPFLDFSRVSVSEKRECPDCEESHWLSKIASCDTCGTMKCINCMEDVGPSQFLGICKTCAGADSDLAYESLYEEPITDQDRFLAYHLGTDLEEDDSLFLPDAGEIQGY